MDSRANYLIALEHIEQDRSDWYNLLKDKSIAQLWFQPNPYVWSAFHILQHLIRTEATVLQYCTKKIQAADLKKVSALTTLKTWYMQFALYQRIIKYRAPNYVKPDELPPDITLDEAFKQWAQVRKQWKDFILSMPEDKLDKEVYKQPFAGRLGWYGTMQFLKGHMGRHRVQLDRVLGEFLKL
ncbi:MAG: DinB family protein [Saprospiraceae bacterium]|nr:DinB family protein [Saprospiraceae bacterium]